MCDSMAGEVHEGEKEDIGTSGLIAGKRRTVRKTESSGKVEPFVSKMIPVSKNT